MTQWQTVLVFAGYKVYENTHSPSNVRVMLLYPYW